MKDNFSIYSLNTAVQNETLAWHCLKNRELSMFEKMLDERMPLTAFMLTAMHCLRYDREDIKRMLEIAEVVDPNVFSWMEKYFVVDELAGFLADYDNLLPRDYPSDEDCIRLKLWPILVERGKYDIVAQNAPEVLEKRNCHTYAMDVALLNADFDKYADKCFKHGLYGAFLAINDGWKYLIDHGKAEWVLSRHEVLDCAKIKEEVAQYCFDKGLIQELYEAGFYGFLMQNNQVWVFVKNHSTYEKFLEDFAEWVDWEDLWNSAGTSEKTAWLTDSIRKELLKVARRHKNAPACVRFLKKHGNWWDRLWL